MAAMFRNLKASTTSSDSVNLFQIFNKSSYQLIITPSTFQITPVPQLSSFLVCLTSTRLIMGILSILILTFPFNSKSNWLEYSYQNNHTPTHSSQKRQITAEARSQILNGPSNIDMYLTHEETSEHIVIGQINHHREEQIARDLAEWVAYWRASGGTWFMYGLSREIVLRTGFRLLSTSKH